MIDITGFTQNDPEKGIVADVKFFDTQTTRASNILSTQIGSLSYDPAFGIDLDFFLTSPVKFQNAGFRSYCVQILASYGISVQSMDESLDALFVAYGFNLLPAEDTTGFVAQ